MKKFKRVLALLLAVVLVFALCACGSNDKDNDKDKDDKDTSKTDKVNKDDKGDSTSEDVISFEECDITIVGAEKFTDFEDKAAMRLWFELTNKTEESNFPSVFYDFSATQDGVVLQETYADYDEVIPEASLSYSYIRPGVTVRMVEEFLIDEDGDKVIVSFKDYVSDDKPVTVEFDLENLAGAPKDEYTYEPITDPKWLDSFEAKGTYEYFDVKYQVSIDKCEFTEGYDGDKLIRVYYTVNNADKEKQYASSIIQPVVYQDGVQLAVGYPDSSTETDDNYYEEVDSGKTVTISNCYVLRSDSPVEVEITNYEGEGLGTVYTVK